MRKHILRAQTPSSQTRERRTVSCRPRVRARAVIVAGAVLCCAACCCHCLPGRDHLPTAQRPVGLPRAARRNHLARPPPSLSVCVPSRLPLPAPSPVTVHPSTVNHPPTLLQSPAESTRPPDRTVCTLAPLRAHAPPPLLGHHDIAIVGGLGPGPGPAPQHSAAHC